MSISVRRINLCVMVYIPEKRVHYIHIYIDRIYIDRICIIMDVLPLLFYFYLLHFYHFIRYSNKEVIDHPVLSLGIILPLFQQVIFSWHPASLLVTINILVFQSLSLVICSENKNGYSI